MGKENKVAKRKHDPLFRWLFAKTERTKTLLELAARHNSELRKFLGSVNLDTLERIPDSYSEVEDSGEADLAFRVNVSTGAPVLVGILLEHKSGHDGNVFNQISRYVHSIMKSIDENRVYNGLPTMAVIFYNGRENWNPLKNIEKGYPEYWHGRILPYACTFINLANIPDEDCLTCDDVATGMGVAVMKHAFNGPKIVEILPKFKESLKKISPDEASCLLKKLKVYLEEYLDDETLKEIDMAFVSIGQKYGFVSAGDVRRKMVADARADERQKAEAKAETFRKKSEEEKLNTAKKMVSDGIISVENAMSYFGYTKEQILGKN